MATIIGPERHDFWKFTEVDANNGAPFPLNNLMSQNFFDEILKYLTFTNLQPPNYRDRFHYIKQIVKAWNKNIQTNYLSGWPTCLDESMSTWTNQYLCPGFMFVPRKTWPFGNKYHLIVA
jgi:Transposase IS4